MQIILLYISHNNIVIIMIIAIWHEFMHFDEIMSVLRFNIFKNDLYVHYYSYILLCVHIYIEFSWDNQF